MEFREAELFLGTDFITLSYKPKFEGIILLRITPAGYCSASCLLDKSRVSKNPVSDRIQRQIQIDSRVKLIYAFTKNANRETGGERFST